MQCPGNFGQAFTVETLEEDLACPGGFVGLPVDDEDPDREDIDVYFYCNSSCDPYTIPEEVIHWGGTVVPACKLFIGVAHRWGCEDAGDDGENVTSHVFDDTSLCEYEYEENGLTVTVGVFA
jgi:hypothetical protein